MTNEPRDDVVALIRRRTREEAAVFGYDMDAMRLTVTVDEDFGRPGTWRCAISRDAHPDEDRSSVRSVRYFDEDRLAADSTTWAAECAADLGRLHLRRRAIDAAAGETRRITPPLWSMTVPEVMASIVEWAGTSMMAIHEGRHSQIQRRLAGRLKWNILSIDAGRYLCTGMDIPGVMSIDVGRDGARLVVRNQRDRMPDTMLLGLIGRRLVDVIGHDALASAVSTTVIGVRYDDDMRTLELDLTPTDVTMAEAPEGVDTSWLMLRK